MATEKTIIINAKTDKAVKEVDKLNKETQKTQKEFKKTEADVSGLTGKIDQMTGGAVTGLKGMLGGVKGVTAGFKTMRGAIISTGLGALVVIIGSLIAAFKGSEEGQNKLNKIFSVTGALIGNLVDLLADFGDAIISAVENPKKSITDFAKLIKENILNRFEGILELIPGLGKAVKQLFSGDFSGAARTAGDAVLKVATGVENFTEKVGKAGEAVKKFAKEQEEEGKAAAKVADMRAKADKIERGLLTRRAELENEIALLRLKSRQEDEFNAKERRQALLDAQVLEDELLEKETEALQLRANAQKMENTFARSNKENLDEEARLEAAVINQKTKRANTARQLQRELNRINGEIERGNKASSESNKKDEEAIKLQKELAQATEKARIRNLEKESERIEAEFQLEIQGIRKKYGKGTQLEAELLIQKNNKLQEIKDKSEREEAQKELERVKQKEALLREFENETPIQKLDREEAEKIAELERLKGTEEEKQRIREFYSGKRDELEKKSKEQQLKEEKILKEQTIAMTAQTFGSIANLLGEQSKAGKAFAVAQALINTFQGISAGVALGFPLAIPAVAAAASTGFGAVKNILSTKPTASGGGGGAARSASASTSAASQVQAPQFNVVGDAGTNQIASTLNEQNENPARAYVVSREMSSQQELDRNIETDSSLG